MEEDGFEFDEHVREMLKDSDISIPDLEDVYGDWMAISQLTPESNDESPENEAFIAILKQLGINIEAVGIVGLKIGVDKQRKLLGIDPEEDDFWEQLDRRELLDYGSSFGAAYMLGFIKGLQQAGHNPLEEMRLAMAPFAKRKHKKARPRPKPKLPEGESIMGSTEELGEFLRSQARRMTEVFDEPNDDWAPILFVCSETRSAMIGMEIPEDEDHKRQLFGAILPSTVQASFKDDKPVLVGMVVSTWALEQEGKPGLHPESVERLACYLSDQEHDELWMAPIYRDGEQPPGLGEWKMTHATEEGEERMRGNIPSMMQRLMR